MQWRTSEESRLACKKTGSGLVSIESLREWNFLNNTIQTMSTKQYFIGLRKESGEWRWISDNSTVNTTKGIFPWAKYEPSGDGDCAVMYKDYNSDYGEYNDYKCTGQAKFGYICESPAHSNGKEGMSPKLHIFCCLLSNFFYILSRNYRPGVLLVLCYTVN